MSTYSELLKDPRWQKVRLKMLESAEWACQRCYDSDSTLAVHHKRYVKGRKPWEYEEYELCVLCESCHSQEHEDKRLHSDLVALMDPDGPLCESGIFAMIAGFMSEMKRVDYAEPTYRKFFDESPYSFELGRVIAALEFRVYNINVLTELYKQICTMDSELNVVIDRIVAEKSSKGPEGL